jgi:hypothetical protein
MDIAAAQIWEVSEKAGFAHMIEACNRALIIWCRCAFGTTGSMSNPAQ